MADNQPIVEFAPFVRFVIEFHNNAMSYAKLLRTKINQVETLTSEEIELIEEAFLIKHIAEFEVLIQNLFAYCVAIDTSNLSEHLDLDLPKKIRFDNAYAIINGLNFFTITTTDELKGLAKKIIVEDNNPFKLLDKQTLNRIDEAYIIRNYVAHKSKRSKKRLLKMYKDKYQIDDFILPGAFLKQKDSNLLGNPYRADIYYGAFMYVSTFTWKHLDPTSYKFVFEDETSEEGIFLAFSKMNQVFSILTKDNNL